MSRCQSQARTQSATVKKPPGSRTQNWQLLQFARRATRSYQFTRVLGNGAILHKTVSTLLSQRRQQAIVRSITLLRHDRTADFVPGLLRAFIYAAEDLVLPTLLYCRVAPAWGRRLKIAITGGTGFIGRHLARALVANGHQVVLIARGLDDRDREIRQLAGATFAPVALDNEDKLAERFAVCDAVAHCAGINREMKPGDFEQVHVEGTRHVERAASKAGVHKIVITSFLRARPNCGSPYHESKWASEEIIRGSEMDY